MKKEIFENSKQEKNEKIESSQESGLESISNETENVINDINKDLESSIKSGEELEKDFPDNLEIKETVEQTNSKAEEAANSSKKNILSIIRESSLGHKIIKGAAMATFLMGMKNVAQAENTSNDKNVNLNKIEASQQNISNLTEAEKQINLDRELLDSPERYNLAKKRDTSGEEREVQENKEKLLEYNIDLVKNRLAQLKNESSLNSKGTLAEIMGKTGIKECEEYLNNPSLKKRRVSNIFLNDQSYIEDNKKSFNFYDKKVKKIAEHISSQEYLDKLTLEYGNEEKAKEHQKVRLNNLYNGTYSLTDETPNFTKNSNHTFSTQLSRDTSNVDIADHEILGHKIVNGLYSSKKTGDLLTLSYQKFDPNSKYFNNLGKSEDEIEHYYSSRSERYAYKQGLEMEMISLGVKKYGEKFTQEHYKKLIDLYNDNKLSAGSCRFIETTKPEYFEQIFNEIAENNDNSKKTFHNPDWNYDQPEDKA